MMDVAVDEMCARVCDHISRPLHPWELSWIQGVMARHFYQHKLRRNPRAPQN